MKIEIGESLIYSWLRHIKCCQIVQTNWKPSSSWKFHNREILQEIMNRTREFFENNLGYDVYRHNVSLEQLINQSECDCLGIDLMSNKIYAVDVAFHENGLQYGNRDETIARVIKKCIRTAMCIYGYFDRSDSNVIFASPVINAQILHEINEALQELQAFLANLNLNFNFSVYANDSFETEILNPVLNISSNVADTTELFLRSCQMLNLFSNSCTSTKEIPPQRQVQHNQRQRINPNINEQDILNGFRNYLIIANYANNTVNSYSNWVRRVCREENIPLTELPDRIGALVVMYDEGGVRADLGRRGRNACICALRRFYEYCNNE